MAARFVPPVVWVVPAVAYVIYAVITYGSFVTNIKHRPVFIIYFKVFIAYSVIAILTGPQFYQTVSLPITLLFFVSSVILMRLTRHEDKVQKQFSYKLISGGPIIALVIVTVMFASAWFTGLLRTAIYTIYFHLLIPIITITMRVIVFVLSPILNLIFGRTRGSAGGDANGPSDMYVWLPEDIEREPYAMISANLILLGIAILVFIMIFVFKKLLYKVPVLFAEEGVTQVYIPLDTGKKRLSMWQKNKLRRVYNRFLVKCRKNGISAEKFFTSETYSQLAAEKFGMDDELSKLREIYLPVRYGGNPEAQVSKEDLDFAKKLVGKLRVRQEK